MAYEKYTWERGETITAVKLNHLEDGVENNDNAFDDYYDKTEIDDMIGDIESLLETI